MKQLFLFDIDGTLSHGGGQDRFNRAINNVHNLGVKSEKEFSGFTDQLILMAMLEDEGWSPEQIETALPRLVQEVDKVHKETFRADSLQIFPGVTELLARLRADGHMLGLVTGNLKPIAERKMEAIGIWQYFTVGGFGSDPHKQRSELVTLAMQRAGYTDHKELVVVIGDTEKDMAAAKGAHAGLAVGVANGLRPAKELVDAGADVVLDDFVDTEAVVGKLTIKP
jgi:phosphoglycolate phosphatase